MYRRTFWLDETRNPDRTFAFVDNGNGTMTFERAGELIEDGTNMSANNFNGMEEGIAIAHAAIDALMQYVLTKVGHSEHTLESLDAAKLQADANAVSATKLATARKIGITGIVTGAGVNFDGSGNININVTEIVEADAGKVKAALDAVIAVYDTQVRALESRIATLEGQLAALTAS